MVDSAPVTTPSNAMVRNRAHMPPVAAKTMTMPSTRHTMNGTKARGVRDRSRTMPARICPATEATSMTDTDRDTSVAE